MSTPTWFNSIVDPTIKADMIAADVNGSLTQSSMTKLFTDLIAKLVSTNSTLSTSQFSDLQLIAANLNVGESASAYLQYITTALVDGNVANATWQGGQYYATVLGNLAAGSSALTLTELTDKWFLGTDLPSIAHISGVNPYLVTYKAVTESLWSLAGPQMSDINQGSLGDCYLCSVLAEVANNNPAAIESMIASNGNNTYSVRFFVDGSPLYVTVNNQLPNGGTLFAHGPDLWVALIEKAYAQLQATSDLTGGSTSYYGNSYATIGAGGYPWYTLEEVTGSSQIVNFAANGSHSAWTMSTLNSALGTQTTQFGTSTSTALSMLVTDLANGNDVVLSSYTAAYDASGKDTLVASHAFSIYGYDSVTGLLELRNPWGIASNGANQNWDTTFEVSLATLLSDGDIISVDNLSGLLGASLANNVLVGAVAADQANSAISAITVSDSVLNVQSNLDALVTDTKLTQISLTDTAPILTITSAQLQLDASVINKIGGTFSVLVNGTQSNNVNTAIYQESVANYAINVLTSTTDQVEHLVQTTTPISVVTYTNVSRLQFSDTMVALDVGSNQSAGSSYLLYQAAFNRTPDAGGLGYWIAAVDGGMNLTAVANAFVNSSEFIADYGVNPSVSSFVTMLYQNALHRAPDAGGLAFWEGQLTSGSMTKAQVLEDFALSPENINQVAPALVNGIHYTLWVG